MTDWVRLIPNPLYAVQVENVITAEDGYVQIERLGNEQTVERILMVARQAAAAYGVFDRCFEDAVSACSDLVLEVVQDLGAIFQFSNACLDCHLPWRSDGNQKFSLTIVENTPCAITEFLR